MRQTGSSTPFYTLLQRRLHWIVLLLLVLQYLAQDLMQQAMTAIEQQQTLSFGQFLVTTWHTWIGALIGGLMLWRWRLRQRAVPLAGGTLSRRQAFWVTLHHQGLYVAVLLMVISGALHYFLSWPLAARWHELGKWLLLVMVAIHVAGALLHLRSGNKVLLRMMRLNSQR